MAAAKKAGAVEAAATEASVAVEAPGTEKVTTRVPSARHRATPKTTALVFLSTILVTVAVQVLHTVELTAAEMAARTAVRPAVLSLPVVESMAESGRLEKDTLATTGAVASAQASVVGALQPALAL